VCAWRRPAAGGIRPTSCHGASGVRPLILAPGNTRAPMLLHIAAAATTLVLAAVQASVEPYLVWHLTDVHVDPWYEVGADATHCYCETAAACPRMKGCVNASSVNASAPALGSSEGNCATPIALFESAAAFMGRTAPRAGVYFTGDFAEAGASYACQGSAAAAQAQVLDIIAYDWATLKAQLPTSRLYGSLGNHDSVPGDIFHAGGPGGGQAWLYDNLTSLWADDVAREAPALATLKQGGYFATRAAPGLTVISLNVNYWCTFAPADAAPSGEAQFTWFAQALAEAEVRGDAVHILGHEPPGDDGSPHGGTWRPGFWARYTALCSKHERTIKGQFYGHIHTDQWTLTRPCRNISGAAINYTETTGIKWCSGGGNYIPRPIDLFGAGDDNKQCPLIPSNWSTEHAVNECKKVCTNASECVGFNLYFNESRFDGMREWYVRRPAPSIVCCRPLLPLSWVVVVTAASARRPWQTSRHARAARRAATRSHQPPRATAQLPVCCSRDPRSPSAHAHASSGHGAPYLPVASSLLSLLKSTVRRGFPATNPAIRLLKFEPGSFELLDATTYIADLHEANKLGVLHWKKEYDFKERFGMDDMSARSFEGLASRLLLAQDEEQGASLWQAYKGQGDGSLYCKGYDSSGSLFPPADPCKACTGGCRAEFVSYLNATALNP
jgi:hypothetical protein